MRFNLKKQIAYAFSILMIISAFLTMLEGTMGVIGLWLLLGSAVMNSCVGYAKNSSSLWSVPLLPKAWCVAIAIPILFFKYRGYPEAFAKLLLIATPFAALLFCLNLIFLIWNRHDKKHVLRNALAAFLIVCFFSMAWVGRANVLLDTNEPQTVTADIVDLVRRRAHRRSNYSMTVSYIDSNGMSQKAYLPLTYEQYSSLHEGDTIQIIVGQGRWDVKYYTTNWK